MSVFTEPLHAWELFLFRVAEVCFVGTWFIAMLVAAWRYLGGGR